MSLLLLLISPESAPVIPIVARVEAAGVARSNVEATNVVPAVS